MTLVLLVRHAHSSANGSGILSGRSTGVGLSEVGKKQAKDLAKRLGEIPVKSLQASPMQRCQETIAPWFKIQNQQSLKIDIDQDLSEVDYGQWTGEKLRKLSKEPLWKVVQQNPSRVTFPEGESLAYMQERAMKALYRGLDKKGRGHVLLVSHGDVIKSIIAAALNMHLDEFQRIVIDPSSISILEYSQEKPRLLLMNDTRSKLNPELFTANRRRPLVGGGAGLPSRTR